MHYEIDSVLEIMHTPSINDNGPELQTVVHRLHRVTMILRVLIQQIDILETMTPMDFLDFRDFLRPASGFQSWQFKDFEAKLGLRFEDQHGKEYYTRSLREAHIEIIKKAENNLSLLQFVNLWLERMPFFNDIQLWKDFEAPSNNEHPFWHQYRMEYEKSLAEVERDNLNLFDLFFKEENNSQNNLSRPARKAALFITLYRGFPLLQLPFQLLHNLLEIDEHLCTWRHRHMNMVHRMIGTRIGTGGSSGKEYLKAAADRHYIFKEIAALNNFLLERSKLPLLPLLVKEKLGFHAYRDI
ncbi:MAG: hypothetical protein NVS1B13_02870 [Flavisolibacter sp.]